MLLHAHADVDHRRSSDGATPLFLAAQAGRTSVVRLLLSEGQADASVATFGKRGLTPLAAALLANHRYTIKELQEHQLQQRLVDLDPIPHMESNLGLTEKQALQRKHAARRTLTARPHEGPSGAPRLDLRHGGNHPRCIQLLAYDESIPAPSLDCRAAAHHSYHPHT